MKFNLLNSKKLAQVDTMHFFGIKIHGLTFSISLVLTFYFFEFGLNLETIQIIHTPISAVVHEKVPSGPMDPVVTCLNNKNRWSSKLKRHGALSTK